MKDLLEWFRNQIDTIDEEIIYLLSRRFELVKQIWLIKKQEGISILQEERWEELLSNLLLEANDKWVNQNVVKDIWNRIHQESLEIEK